MPAALRVLHIQGSFDLGGKEARTVRLMNVWGASVRHVLWTGNPAMNNATAALADDVDWTLAPGAPSIMGRPTFVRLRAMARYMRGFDLVLTYNWGAINAVLAHRLFRRAMRLPRLIHHEDGFNADEAARLKRSRNIFRRIALGGASALVVPSCRLEHIAVARWGQRPEKVHNIPNGIDVAAYARPPAPDAIPGLDKGDGRVVVGTLAGLRAVKDLPRLVRIVAPLRDRVRLVIVGEGPERDVIQGEADRLGFDGLVLPGFLPRPQDYIGLFDIFALTSRSEQFPISLVEAMAAGLPAPTTDVGDIAAMIAPANRPYVYPAEDGAGMQAGLLKLAEDPALRARIGAANRARALDAFDERRMVARYGTLYGDAAGRGPLVH